MSGLYITSLILIMAVAANSISVYSQKRYNFYTKNFGKKDQTIHSLVIMPFWAIFLAFVSRLNNNMQLKYGFINLWFVEVIVLTVAVVLFISSIKIIGSGALVNSNFFTPQKKVESGIYRYLKNPIYDSYALFFLGLGLIYSNWGYFALSALIWLLLICVEARVEKI